MPQTVAELEEALVRADLGTARPQRVAGPSRKGRYDAEISEYELRAILAREIAAHPEADAKSRSPSIARKKPFVILVAGVNGTGKTTTIGKIAKRLERGT